MTQHQDAFILKTTTIHRKLLAIHGVNFNGSPMKDLKVTCVATAASVTQKKMKGSKKQVEKLQGKGKGKSTKGKERQTVVKK